MPQLGTAVTNPLLRWCLIIAGAQKSKCSFVGGRDRYFSSLKLKIVRILAIWQYLRKIWKHLRSDRKAGQGGTSHQPQVQFNRSCSSFPPRLLLFETVTHISWWWGLHKYIEADDYADFTLSKCPHLIIIRQLRLGQSEVSISGQPLLFFPACSSYNKVNKEAMHEVKHDVG